MRSQSYNPKANSEKQKYTTQHPLLVTRAEFFGKTNRRPTETRFALNEVGIFNVFSIVLIIYA